MFCQNCGASNDDSNKFCQSCGANLGVATSTNEQVVTNTVTPNSNTSNNSNVQMPEFKSGHSIFLLIFSLLCCGGVIGAVFAILSLVEGDKVKEFAAKGDLENALRCKQNANKWIKATYITWAVVAALMLIYLIFIFVVSFASAM